MNLYISRASDPIRVSECREIVAAFEGNDRTTVDLPFGNFTIYQRSRRLLQGVFFRAEAPL